MEREKLLKVLLLSTVIVLSSCKKDSPTPIDPVDPVALADCNEVVGGTSLMDECGVCQQAYIYNVVTHDVTFLDDTSGVVAGNNEMLVMPDSPSSPYWSNVSMPAEFSFTADGYNTVSYGGQTARLDMASEMMSAIASTGTTADALMGMFAHEAGGMDFEDADLNASSKQIKSKTAAYSTSGVQMAIHASFDSWFIDYATNVAPIVGTTTMAAAGSAGMAGNRELNAKGMEYDQIAAKSLIGALCLDQVVNGYLSEGKIGDAVDNVTRDPNEDNNATAMEHHWDEAYGYFTDAIDYPINGADRFWGKYCNKQDGNINCNADMMDNLLMGRAALSSDVLTDRDAAIATIRTEWEDISANQAMTYLDESIPYFGSDNAKFLHVLAEAWAFAWNLRYAPVETRRMSVAEHTALMGMFKANFWEMTVADVNAIKAEIDAKY